MHTGSTLSMLYLGVCLQKMFEADIKVGRRFGIRFMKMHVSTSVLNNRLSIHIMFYCSGTFANNKFITG